MKKKRSITDNVIQRARKADDIISKWMRANNIGETDPEGCIHILVNEGVYRYSNKGKEKYFRDDLRDLRAIADLVSLQTSKWIRKLEDLSVR